MESKEQHISLFQFLKRFPDEDAAIKFYEEQRWPSGARCPFCDRKDTVSAVKSKKPLPYHCKACREYFSVKTGTVMQSSKLPLQKWLLATYFMTTAKKGISSCQLSREMGVTQKTAWFLLQRIRESWSSANPAFLCDDVEVDEVYLGGKEKNKHASKRLKQGRGAVGKSAVLGILSRSQKRIKAFPLTGTSRQELHDAIKLNVSAGSQVYTDEHSSYKELIGCNHESVRHSAGEYVRDQAHTNGIESFWATLKRGYYGVYHFFTVKHLHRYVNEFATRYNTRFLEPIERLGHFIRLTVDKRLLYCELIA